MKKFSLVAVLTIIFTLISVNANALTTEMVNNHEFASVAEIAKEYKAEIIRDDGTLGILKKDNVTIITQVNYAWININIINYTSSRIYEDAPTYYKNDHVYLETEFVNKAFNGTFDKNVVQEHNKQVYATAEPAKSENYSVSFEGMAINMIAATNIKNKKLYTKIDAVADYFGATLNKIGYTTYVLEKGPIKITLRSGKYWYTIENTSTGEIKKIMTVNKVSLKYGTMYFELNDAVDALGGIIEFDKIANLYIVRFKN